MRSLWAAISFIMSSASLSVFYAFARSGGTLINRCLSSIQDNLVLSEVNPHGSLVSLEYQASQWLNLISDQEKPTFADLNYCQKIDWLRQRAPQQAHLIIRDWPVINFLDVQTPLSALLRPSFILEQEFYLNHGQLGHRAIVISRQAADIYESLKRTFPHFSGLGIGDFGKCYLKYAQSVAGYKTFQYEKFCQKPEYVLKQICSELSVNYDENFLNKFYEFDRCTGDNALQYVSRGKELRSIKPLKSNVDSAYYIEAKANQECQMADSLFEYAL